MLIRSHKRIRTAMVLLVILFITSFSWVYGENLTGGLLKGVRREVLDNGLTVITLENRDSSLVSINIFVNTGSINEDDQIAGISHFCEHMFYRGTGERTGIEMKQKLEELGGYFNAETSKDYTRYYVNAPSEWGLDILKIYCDAVKNASYPQDTVNNERKVILEEYNMSEGNPGAIMSDGIFSLYFGKKHPYGRPVIGTVDTIKKISREDLLKYKKRFYIPSNMSIVIVGNFDRMKYISFIKQFFADMSGDIKEVPVYPKPQPLEENKEEIKNTSIPIDNALFVLGYMSPGFRDRDDVVAMDLLVFLLGQGEHSLLNQELNLKREIVDDMSASFFTSKEPGLIMFATRVPNRNIEKLKESVFSVLSRVKRGDFSDEEVERARKLLVNTYLFGLETNEGKADALGFYEMLGDMKFATEYEERVKKITRQDLIDVANKYFNSNYSLFVMKHQGKQNEYKDE